MKQFKINGMQGFKFIIGIMLIGMLGLSSCTDDDDLAIVSFTQSELEVVTDTLTTSRIEIELSSPAPQNSNVIVIAPGNSYANAYTTVPGLDRGEILITVEAGSMTAHFDFVPLESGIGFDDFQQNFEIIATGPGLATNTFEGRFLNFNLINERVQEDDLPFVENFNVCGPNGSFELPPEDWTLIDVAQNSFGTGGYFCYTGQGVTGVGTNPFTPDGEQTQGDDYSEAWLISPSISLGGAESPSLSFDFDRRFDAPIDDNTLAYGLQISTDFDGSNFETANWEVFQPAVEAMTANDPGFDNIENTGPLDLSAYEGEDISIAFIFRAADAYFQATSIRIANVRVE
ncbi:choice-of-anchor J domain-containing protein [Psychroflexus tropicus]|uniref:choice-of-anchor J domain-containing protein n=1 Tax=Psychroflexus tropicus TaxID=197345 RepID=UPI0003A46B5B|nr:choice-of-anchor J domain-containing protein [Psychroflexus tropicus]